MADKKEPKRKVPGRIYLKEDETRILETYLGEWNEKPDKRSRDAYVVSDVLPKVQALDLERFGPELLSKDKQAKQLWENRVKAIHRWFKNNRPFKDRAVFRLERKIPLRRVVGKIKASDIQRMVASKNPDIEKGDKSYPGLFQKALTQYMDGMEETEKDQLVKIRGEWQESGPPLDVQLRAAKRYSRRGIINAHELLDKEMAVQCITYSWFPDADTGVLGVVCHDYISGLHAKKSGTKLKTFREWNEKGHDRIVADMMGYAQYVQSHTNEEDRTEAESDTRVTYENGPGMLPLLPTEFKGVRGMEVAKSGKDIIRSYFQRHYSLAAGDVEAKTPWAKIGEDPCRFFDAECYPVGFRFEDPSRMGKSVMILLKHLRERQETLGVNAFHFHHYFKDKAFRIAEYPEDAKAAIDAGVDAMDWACPISNSGRDAPSATFADVKPATQTPVAKKAPRKGKAKEITSTAQSSISSIPPLDPSSQPSWPMPDVHASSSDPMPQAFNYGMGGFAPMGFHPMYAYPPHMYNGVSSESGMGNIDPRLWPALHQTQDAPPSGDPFFMSRNPSYPHPPFGPTTSSHPPGYAPYYPQGQMPAHASSSALSHPPMTSPPTFPHSALSTVHHTKLESPLNAIVQKIGINPPTFSPSSTPSRTPKRRKRDEKAAVSSTPSTSKRPKRNITTPKRFSDNI